MSENVEQSASVNQPLLDKYVKIITEKFGDQVIEDAYINQTSKDIPTLVIKKESWKAVAEVLKQHEELAFDYLSNLLGVDYEKHMETVYYFYSYKNRQPLAVRVKLDREKPEVDSITSLWSGANWNERETYDLLGIVFKGHPNLSRILLPEDWVGYPLRKDYQPYDEGV
ncbi:NADH-quinone oxidoreductase subunit C [Microaerobacter geothermalis]|uniref:NADH-quinone oxidoreductase subunit C n=1 Tax=Microaerobacter geothermalis TaxID=674972 RepID=UPI002E2FC630|nr:NADH-quinone oxidoreductase subunit C [Microaerobacter geothermalis]